MSSSLTEIPLLGRGGGQLPPRLGDSVGLDAPLLPASGLTSATKSQVNQPQPTPLSEQALGQASNLLDAVRQRRVSWQRAHELLQRLSDQDKKTLARFRPDMGEDEKRALDLPTGGGLLGKVGHFLGQGLLADIGIHVPTGGGGAQVAGNLVTDTASTVRALPAGLVKTGEAVAQDVGTLATDPARGITLPHTREDIVQPMWDQYAHTYGPAIHGDFGETAHRIGEHPLGPLLDAFAVASAGIGTAARVGAAARAIDATKVVEEAPGVYRMGKVDRSTEQYEPLGYSKEYYVRPTKKQMKDEPWRGYFSVLINTKTGKSLFSPIGSSHDEIYDPLFQGRGTAKAKDWGEKGDFTFQSLRDTKPTDVVQARGIFDPETGKVRINIDPEDIPSANVEKVPGMIEDIRKQAESVYPTAKDFKATQKTNEAGSIVIRQGKATNRYDPTTGEKLDATWYVMRPGGQRIASNFPTAETAIAHAQSLVTGGVLAPVLEQTFRDWVKQPSFEDPLGEAGQERLFGANLRPRSAASIGASAFRQRPRGGLIDAYESVRGISHAQEYESVINEVINNVLNQPGGATRKQVRQAVKDAVRDAAESFATTGSKDIGRFRQRTAEQPEFISPATSAALSAVGISLREVSDMVRAGAVFLRPAYIPNNWAGNAFLNTIQQGVYAPVNLAKAMFLDKNVGTRYTRAIDQAMGFNATSVMTGGRGAGYVASATDPVAKLFGSIADQPFRRAAWIHEARRAGYKKMSDVQRLWDQAMAERHRFENKDPGEWDLSTAPALGEIAKISRAAQEEIIKFDKYNDVEKGVLRNLIFVYSWMRGAARYFGRFPMQHPIQAAAMTSIAGVGQNWLNQELGGVPAFLIGAIPVGKDEKGNHMLINPFSINPLSTGMEILQSAASLKNIVTDPRNFNKYVNQDPSALLNPLVQDALEAWSGGRSMTESVPDSIAALRLKENLEHPGRGQIYPTSRQEALGQYFLGSMFPRMSSEVGIKRSLQRERADKPELRIDDEVAAFEKSTGAQVPQQFVEMYRQDLEKLKAQKDFQHSYAKAHGSQGFSNMPAANRADAALDYLSKNHLVAPRDLASLQQTIDNADSDYEKNIIANALWRMTGAGAVKDKWDELMHTQAAVATETPLRP